MNKAYIPDNTLDHYHLLDDQMNPTEQKQNVGHSDTTMVRSRGPQLFQEV